jgi:hypothetical protein
VRGLCQSKKVPADALIKSKEQVPEPPKDFAQLLKGIRVLSPEGIAHPRHGMKEVAGVKVAACERLVL